MSTRDLVLQTIVQVGSLLAHVTNAGGTGDEADLYYLLDYLTFSIHRAYPEIPCKEGCSACCHEYGMPAVSALEWERVEAAVRALPADVRARIQERLEARYRPLLGELAAAAIPAKAMAGASREGLGEAFPHMLGTLPCPLLENHRCSIYDDRPAICRAFGYFTLRRAAETTLFTCKWAAGIIQQAQKDKGLADFPLPVWNKFAARLAELNPEGASTKYLPQWLLEMDWPAD